MVLETITTSLRVPPRHCERIREATQKIIAGLRLGCFVATLLAMTCKKRADTQVRPYSLCVLAPLREKKRSIAPQRIPL